MSRSIYDKQLVRWVKSHYWDSLEKDKDIILRHIRTFAGGNVEQENAEALKPSHNTGMDAIALLKEAIYFFNNYCGISKEQIDSFTERANAVVAQQHHA